MFEPGQTFRFKTDPNGELFTIVAVSPYAPMVKIDGGWVWTDNIEIIENADDVWNDFLTLNFWELYS